MNLLRTLRLPLLSIFIASSVAQSTTVGQQPIVIAHRGASGYLPEHTLEAKALAAGQGADFLEQDVVLTKDGIPIVLHDIHLDLVTDVAKQFPERKRSDGRFYAIDFSLAEIKQLSVTERTSPKSGSAVFSQRFPIGHAGLHVNTLEEELAFVAGINQNTPKKIGIYTEIKKPAWHLEQGQDISAKVVKLLQQHGYTDKSHSCWLQCFEPLEIERIRRELNWQGRLVQLIGNGNSPALDNDGFAALAKIVDAVGPELGAIVSGTSPQDRKATEFVAMAHRHNLQVHPFTIRADDLPKWAASLEDLHRLLFVEAQVDGVFTDFPNLAIEFLSNNRIATTRLKGLTPIPLWPSTPPGQVAAKGEERDTSTEKSNKVEGQWVIRLGDVSKPTVTFYPAPQDQNTGACVVVCPGGGYNILAWDLEGTEVCQWLNSIGVSAALLKYRVPRIDKSVPIEPLQDAQRALSLVRSKANEWQLKPDRIGILGFSAGGHLSARASTGYQKRSYDEVDEIDKVSCRPDFALLIYPAYLFDKTKDDLINPDLPVDSETPPMFLTMAMDDPIDAENILRMSTALKRAKVPNEVHLYPTGGHGYGLRRNRHEATSWPVPAASWMKAMGLLKGS
jgi:glycerophosphoryl diester phosphodiesterase